MGKSSRIKRRAMKSQRRVRRGGGSYGFYGAVVAVSVIGISLVAVSKANKSDADVFPRANQDHWHAALAVNDCGTWLEPGQSIPEFHNRVSNTQLRAGIHSHGDGLMHIHPYSGDESGDNATVGNFMEFGGWKVDSDEFKVGFPGPETKRKNGDKCGEGKDALDGELRWTVNGEEQKSNPASYRPQDQDVIGIYFVGADVKLEDLGEVPSKANLANPSDVETTSPPPSDSPPTDSSGDVTSTSGGTSTSTGGDGSSTTAAPAPTTATTVATPTS